MTDFTYDDRLPYVVTSSIKYGTSAMRILRCTIEGKIATASETYDAPVIDIPVSAFADKCFESVCIITPDEETAAAINNAGGSAVEVAKFKSSVSEVATLLKATPRESSTLATREAIDASSSAYATAQEVYAEVFKQMPRVQSRLIQRASL